ncbi:nitrate reductase cytochrome c-type subunit [Thalassococcus sp. CAU 1522]|uniref:Periplasmic nitrate reductase, electron transfer subunit n=1 Tax=Thalassococcus arenae TaxID=2851652 RepID=A0ABS6NA81_9RHOB|nr:nitrate reductase cytochrome c-type subunit [Thalassococcus arenae]MBV2360936.1 nitrate reductase cytochrome c-type subunit [Thalassococcus arenae]
MKKQTILSLSVAAALVISGGLAIAQSAGSGVSSLRGSSVADLDQPLNLYQQDEGRFARAYRQQPPLIPHGIDNYQIDTNANRCLACHDWTNAAERHAPTLSMTHYQDRDGNQMDRISGTRWFCTQCHVPQANAPELVENIFNPSSGN